MKPTLLVSILNVMKFNPRSFADNKYVSIIMYILH